MSTVIFKKKWYYCGIVLVLIYMCLQSDFIVQEGKLYSVIDAIAGKIAGVENMFSMHTVFEHGLGFWFYIMLPIATVPFITYVSEESASGFQLFEIERQNTIRFMLKRVLFALFNSAVIVLLVFAFFSAIINFKFDMNEGMLVFLSMFLKRYVYFVTYIFAISLFGALCVYIYNDIYVDISLLLIFNYIFKNIAMGGSFFFPMAIIIVTVVLYLIVRKKRYEKI